ncbi:hypothetical protein MUP07_03575 [Candidatus Bathyarchaeota archaeon]|nr:hypothetical protein [Candidatus Bathyarchaeota archaeon]
MVDEIKAKVTVPDLLKAKVTQPEELTGKVGSEVMLDPDVNLIRVAGQPIGHTAPVPVRLTDGAEYIDPRVIENPPALDVDLSTRASEATLGDIKAQTDKMTFDVGGALNVQNPPNLDAKLSDVKSKTDNLDAKLSDVKTDLENIKTDTDNLSSIKGQTDKLEFDASGNLKAAEQGTVTVTGAVDADVTGTVVVTNIDAKLSDIKSKTDNLDAKLSDVKTGTDYLSAIKAKTDNIPASPSQEHVAANDPHAVRLTDGSAFLDPRQVSIQELDALLRYMLQTGLFQTSVDSAGRLRVIIDVAGTATPVTISSGTVTTVSTLSAITTFPYGQAMGLDQMMYLVYQDAQRDKMTFS